MAILTTAQKSGKRYLNPVPTLVGTGSTMLKAFYRLLIGREERVPKTPIGPFHTDAALYQQPPQTGLRVTWFGHSSSLLEMDGIRVLIDPIWEQRAAPVQWFGPRRFFAPTLPLAALPQIDVILISHDHYDHLGGDTMRALAGADAARQARWITSLGVGEVLAGFGVEASRVTELDWTGTVQVGDLQITALPARHFSGRSLFNRFQTLWSSFVLATPDHRVFYGADSGEWEGFAEIGAQHGPFDLAMLEIGAFDPLWADIHMGPDGALRTFEALRGGLLMPIHWGLFNLAIHGWRQPIQRMHEAGKKLWSPAPGQPTDVVPGVEVRSDWWKRT